MWEGLSLVESLKEKLETVKKEREEVEVELEGLKDAKSKLEIIDVEQKRLVETISRQKEELIGVDNEINLLKGELENKKIKKKRKENK